MTVCVDKLRACKPNANWPYSESCHLFSDSRNEEELHTFAKQLGLRRSWVQNRRGFPHYDLTANMRRKAIKAGAKEVPMKLAVMAKEQL